MNYGFSLKISKFNKSAGWNKGVQVGKFLKFNKVCCTIIRETKVLWGSVCQRAADLQAVKVGG